MKGCSTGTKRSFQPIFVSKVPYGVMMEERTLEEIRLDKLQTLSEHGNPYPERFALTHEIIEAAALPDGTETVRVAGRILSIRKMGKLAFFTVADIKGQLQAALKQDEVGVEVYEFFHRTVDIGDFIGLCGSMFTTKRGEKTLRTEEYSFLGKALLPLPEKFHGIRDLDACGRQRYLDLIMNGETRSRFLLKSELIKTIRRFLEDERYIEVETPVLTNKPSGALARPFLSHHNALDIDVYLRIAPETYLKRAVIGGYTKVFEFARCFRNEGMDPGHLQDFTMLEAYCAYYNYQDNMKFLQRMLRHTVQAVFGGTEISIGGNLIDFLQEWPVVSFRELLQEDCGIDIDKFETAAELLAEIRRRNIDLGKEDELDTLGKGNLIDQLYKKVSRPKLQQPTFLIRHPISLSPLARANDDDSSLTDRFQLLIGGAEVINGYSELVDPIEQEKRLLEQARLQQGGDEDAMCMDTDYITAMRYGMPPISGWGMGIDRLMQVLTGQQSLRDSVLFPIMRPVEP